MSNRWQRLHAWCFGPADLHAMVFARIVLGFSLFFAYLMRWSAVPEIYGPNGLGGLRFLERYAGRGSVDPFFTNFDFIAPMLALRSAGSDTLVWAVYFVLLASALAFALGARTRTAGLIALTAHILMHGRAPYSYWGWSTMVKPFLLYVALAPSGRWLSLDAWWAGRPLLPAGRWTGPAWPMRLVQVHVCTMYLVLWQRLEAPDWKHGRMLFVALTNRTFGRPDFDLSPYQGVLEVLCLMALVLEVGAPILLWVRGLGAWWALALIGVHAQIELTATVGWWNFVMASALLTFLPPAWFQKLLARWARGDPPASTG